MNVSIFGLGYVGAVTAGCLADIGHLVSGVDVQKEKVRAFNEGRSPIIEPLLEDLILTAKQAGKLSATVSEEEAVLQSDVSIICVGTPSLDSGSLNLDYVRKVSQQIATVLKASGKKQVIIYRSTMLPGSTRGMVRDFFEEMRISGQVHIYYCPEFLREGTAVNDFRAPSLAVVGTHDGKAAQNSGVEALFGCAATTLTWEGAEMIKYSCNYFHALKVGFANEIGRLCKHLGEDGARVMDVVCRDTRLNISTYYMKPGTPFGGSCLPKDVSALQAFGEQSRISLPLLDNMLDSNAAHLDTLLKLITSKGVRKIGLLGLAFKAGTDDVRGSAMLAVAESLLSLGYDLCIYDPSLNLSRLIGANAAEMNRRMPHLASLLKTDVGEVISHVDLVVASQACVPVETLAEFVKAEQHVIDVNGWRELASLPWSYEGLCW